MIRLLEGLLRGPVYDALPEVSGLVPPGGKYPEPEAIEKAAYAEANYEVACMRDECKGDRDQLPLPGMRDVSVELAALDLLFREAQMRQAYIDFAAPHGRYNDKNRRAYDRLRAFIMEHV